MKISLAAVQVGDLAFEQQMEMIVARDVAGSAGARTHCPQRLFHGREHRRMLPHAEVIVRAPHGDFGPDAVIEGPRKAAAAPFEIGEDAVAPLSAQRLEALVKEPFVIHRRHAHQISASRWGRNIDLVSVTAAESGLSGLPNSVV